MRKKIEWTWEKLDDITWRAKVIGGWIVKSVEVLTSQKNNGVGLATCFLPDKDHEWTIVPSIVQLQAKEENRGKDFEG